MVPVTWDLRTQGFAVSSQLPFHRLRSFPFGSPLFFSTFYHIYMTLLRVASMLQGCMLQCHADMRLMNKYLKVAVGPVPLRPIVRSAMYPPFSQETTMTETTAACRQRRYLLRS